MRTSQRSDRLSFRVDGQDYGLRAEFAREFGDQFGAFNGRGIDGDFVGAGADDGARIFERANAAAGSERDSEFGGDAADRFPEM